MSGSVLKVAMGGHSTAGIKDENQDAFAAWHGTDAELTNKGVTAVIADGVSACSRAKEASQMAVTSFINDYRQTPVSWTVKKAEGQILTSLNRWCHSQVDYSVGSGSQCVTTFTGLIFKSATAFVFHAGDSRLYRCDAGNLEQITKDHTLGGNKGGSLIRALGIDSRLEIDYQSLELRVGDVFLLSTDGLHGFISAAEFKEILKDADESNLEQKAEALTRRAIENGSDDNVSCLLLKVVAIPKLDLEEACKKIYSLAIPPALEDGMKLEGYRVVEMLFNGTRSSLYKVVEEATGQLRCLKTPSSYFSDDPVYLDGFLREEWVGSTLNHPHIMKIVPRPASAKFMYHICEYVEGATLRQWIIDNPQPSFDKVRRLILQMIKALRAMQRQQMVHRDIKPENVMLTDAGEIKLIDFGTVLVAAHKEVGLQLQEGMPVGSVNYIAPEYLIHNEADFRSDLFSTAVVCYELLTGKLPYSEMNSDSAIPVNYHAWEYVPLSRYRSDLPIWLDECLKKALRPNPAYRYEAFSEFESDLHTPGVSLIRQTKQKPLIERNPVLVWQGISVILLALLVLSLFRH